MQNAKCCQQKYRGRRVEIQLLFPLCKTWFGVARTIDQPATRRAETSIKNGPRLSREVLQTSFCFPQTNQIMCHKLFGAATPRGRPCSMLPNYILPAFPVSGIILTHDSHFCVFAAFIATSFPQRFHFISLELIIILESEWWSLETMWLQCYSSFHFAGKN